MRRHTVSIIFIIILSLLFASNLPAKQRAISVRPVSPSGGEISGNQWLFVIGINTYIDWPRLKTAVNDAKAVRDVLLSRYYLDKGHLIELYDEQATRKNIIGKLRYLAKNATKDDSIIIFYAGHGYLDPITKMGSWIPVESGTKDASAWVSNNYIKNYLKVDAIKAKHILLISDSCFSGDFFRGHRGKLPIVTDEVIKRAYKLTSRQAITSGGLEPVSDEGFGKNSVFTYFLVKTLKENGKPFLVASDFYPDIKAGVAENAEQFPRLGSLKDTGGQQGGELVLFLKQDWTTEDLSVKARARRAELERLKQLETATNKAETAARIAKAREEKEIAEREREIAILETKIGEMKKSLNDKGVKSHHSLDSMLAIVLQKEEQERNLENLRKQREQEAKRRQEEIDGLKRERLEKTIAMLKPHAEKYNKIVSSKYGKGMEKEAWKILMSICPEGWADGLVEGDSYGLLVPPHKRTGMKKDMQIKKLVSPSPEKRLYDVNLALYRDEKYEEAIAGFKKFIKKFPKSLLADNAQYWVGESYMALKQYEQAILAFQVVIKHYPKGSKVPNAILRQAISFYEIKDRTSSRLLLKKLILKYPKSSEAKIAKAKLRVWR